MTEHPDPAVLTDFLLGRLAPKQTGTVVAHLIPGCGRCQEEMEPLALAILNAEGFERALSPEEEEAYDGAISTACRRVIERLREEREAKAPRMKGAVILSCFSAIPRRPGAPAPRSASR